jgi:predicted transcriptional regulator
VRLIGKAGPDAIYTGSGSSQLVACGASRLSYLSGLKQHDVFLCRNVRASTTAARMPRVKLDLNFSNSYDNRITIGHFGGKQMPSSSSDKISLSADIVAAYVSRNSVTPGGLPALIKLVHSALTSLGAVEAVPKPEVLVPAVPVRKSITPGFLICLDDGKKFKSLKRHLANLGMTPDQYRAKWGLPKDYPMVAPEYAATRSALAKKIGLGRLVNDAGEPESGGTPEAVPEEAAS